MRVNSGREGVEPAKNFECGGLQMVARGLVRLTAMGYKLLA